MIAARGESTMNQLVIAESAIRQLHARYADALWRKDPESFADLFAEDAEWKVAGMHMRGRAEIKTSFAKFMRHIDRTLMSFGTPIVEIVPGGATSRTYVTENNKFADGRTASTIGIYYERFVDQGDRWRFQWRHWNLYYIGPPDFSAALYDCKEFGPPPGMPSDDDPTTVRKDFLFTASDGAISARP
jgi:ketosteroid isomerase-like protein